MTFSRRVLLATVVLALLFAGCTSSVPSTETETVTPGQSPTTAATLSQQSATTSPKTAAGTTSAPGTSANPTFESIERPPGVTATEVNTMRLIEAHFDSLAGTGYVASLTEENDAFPGLRQNMTIRKNADGTRWTYHAYPSADDPRPVESYTTDGTTHLETFRNGDPTYSSFEGTWYGDRYNGSRTLNMWIAGLDFTVDGVEMVDSEPRVVLRASEAAEGSDYVWWGTVTDATARLVVDTDGRIHSFHAELTQEGSTGSSVDWTYDYRLTRVGEIEVQRPDWVETARAQTLSVDLSYDSNESVVIIEHDGGDTIPTGTTVVVQNRYSSWHKSAALETQFEAGEQLYLVPGSSTRLYVQRGPPEEWRSATWGPYVEVRFVGEDGELIAVGLLPIDDDITIELLPEGDVGGVDDDHR